MHSVTSPTPVNILKMNQEKQKQKTNFSNKQSKSLLISNAYIL